MKTKEEIEQMALEYSVKLNNSDDAIEFGFVEGYTQCQEDMADKKYTEEDLRNAYEHGSYSIIDNGHGDTFDEYINSLNKQD